MTTRFRLLPRIGALVALAVLASGCDYLNQDEYEDRVEAIDAVYQQGVEVRAKLLETGTDLPDEASCSDAFYRFRLDEERFPRHGDSAEAFAELRELSFINGCLGRPNDLPPIPLPGDVVESGSPSPSPSGSVVP